MKEIFLQISNRQTCLKTKSKQSLTAFSKMKSQKAKSLPAVAFERWYKRYLKRT